jgi:hypothetical protein
LFPAPFAATAFAGAFAGFAATVLTVLLPPLVLPAPFAGAAAFAGLAAAALPVLLPPLDLPAPFAPAFAFGLTFFASASTARTRKHQKWLFSTLRAHTKAL